MKKLDQTKSVFGGGGGGGRKGEGDGVRKGRTPLERGTRTLPAAKYIVVMERDRISGKRGPPPPPRPELHLGFGKSAPRAQLYSFCAHISLPPDRSEVSGCEVPKAELLSVWLLFKLGSLPLAASLAFPNVPLLRLPTAVSRDCWRCTRAGVGGPWPRPLALSLGGGIRVRVGGLFVHRVVSVFSASHSLSSRPPWSPP